MARPVLFVAKSFVHAHRRRKAGGGLVFVRDYQNRVQAQGREPPAPKPATADTRTGDLFAQPAAKKEPADDSDATPAGWRKDGKRYQRSWKVDAGKRDHRLVVSMVRERTVDGNFTIGIRERYLGPRGYIWGWGAGPYFAKTLAEAAHLAETHANAFLQRQKKPGAA